MSVHRAFDELRFGPGRTLNLRAVFPSGDEAALRAEKWLRQQQVEKADEVLLITGAGRGSDGGVGVVRESVVRLLSRLRRQNVILQVQEHTAGSFVVQLAPVKALFEAPKRRGEPMARYADDPTALAGLDPATRSLLRDLARRALESLGAQGRAERFVRDEMVRQFAIIARGVTAGPGREARLQDAIRRTIAEYDDEP